jgi:hypothetical protein
LLRKLNYSFNSLTLRRGVCFIQTDSGGQTAVSSPTVKVAEDASTASNLAGLATALFAGKWVILGALVQAACVGTVLISTIGSTSYRSMGTEVAALVADVATQPGESRNSAAARAFS